MNEGVSEQKQDFVNVRSPALRGVEFVAASYRPPPPLLPSQLTVVLCDEGSGAALWGRERQPLTAGAVLVRAPHQMATVLQYESPQTRCRIVLIEPELLGVTHQELAARLPPSGSWVSSAPSLCQRVTDLWEGLRGGEAAQLQGAFGELIAELVALACAEGPRTPSLTPAVARTRQLLHEHFAEEVPLQKLAELAGMSKYHLVHLFHKEIGVPPHAYQIQLRVARARRLVAEGVPLVEVASVTGFADQSHLTRLFKRLVGIPPGQFAAAIGTPPRAASEPTLASAAAESALPSR